MSPKGGGTAPPGYPSMSLSPLATLAGTDNGSGKLAHVVGEQPTSEKITTAVKEEEGQDAAQLLLSFGKKS
ncbi:hypothetical protein TrLO_g6218 [Triparma laevis f. longispina]|nr:hypothetical protein TrLO_g6218 [Triparma laevis f. longispina]